MKSILRLNFLYFCMLFIIISNTSEAGHVIQAFASYDHGVYTFSVEMEVHSDAENVRELLIDFDKMKIYNTSIVQSNRLNFPDPQVILGRIEIRDCILFFCVDLVQVQKIQQLASGDLQVTILPEFSDYRMGKSLWHITQQDKEHTLLQVDAVMEPKIWVPPLIGTALVSNLLKNRAISMIEGLESLTVVSH